MPFHPLKSDSLADQIFTQIASEILGGHSTAGTRLPAERKLSELFDVNRHVVREALKRLEQIGLIRISQGGHTEVLDFRLTAGLDLLSLLAQQSQGSHLLLFWRSVLEMRAALAADIVRLFTERAAPALKAELQNISEQMRTEPDNRALFQLELRFWDTLLLGADNLAYRLAYNSLLRGLHTLPEAMLSWSMDEIRRHDYHQVLVEAIDRGDALAAEQNVHQLLRKGLQRLQRALGASSSASPAPASVGI